jgi:hypothetical protein
MPRGKAKNNTTKTKITKKVVSDRDYSDEMDEDYEQVLNSMFAKIIFTSLLCNFKYFYFKYKDFQRLDMKKEQGKQ